MAFWKRWDFYNLGYERFSKVLHQFCKAEVIMNSAGEKRKLSLGGDGAMPGLKPGLSGVKPWLSPGWADNFHHMSHVQR